MRGSEGEHPVGGVHRRLRIASNVLAEGPVVEHLDLQMDITALHRQVLGHLEPGSRLLVRPVRDKCASQGLQVIGPNSGGSMLVETLESPEGMFQLCGGVSDHVEKPGQLQVTAGQQRLVSMLGRPAIHLVRDPAPGAHLT